MFRHEIRLAAFTAACLILVLAIGRRVEASDVSQENAQGPSSGAELVRSNVTQGALRHIQPDGSVVECPLKHTDVKGNISGFIAHVNVTQTFVNPTDDAIEAVYVFPLPHKAAVANMTMIIGERRIVGVIKRRMEARQIYEQAMMQGQTAALLEQERPNIFTQSVANIGPGQKVRIEISYVDVLKYDMQEYEFYFPMVVGPRFMPGQPSGAVSPRPQELSDKVSPPVANTTRVEDAARISPPVLRPGHRTGHDISLTLTIDAGVPIEGLTVANHEAEVQRDSDTHSVVKLSSADSVPNKDFVVRYDVAGAAPEMALLAHTGEYSKDVNRLGNGYFMLMIQPQEDERMRKSPPREIVFLVDVSGSMRGTKTAKTVEAMKMMLGLCRDVDTVQVITFASRTNKLFERPVPVNEANVQRALNFANELRGSGGTHMLEGVKTAIDEPLDPKRVRIVVMLTDGFIGNEAEIIQHVGDKCGDHVRFWSVGIGQSPNMFLVDGVAKQGGGMGKRLGLNDETEVLATEIVTRIQRAQLANIKIDWGDAAVAETYPLRIPELWAGRPVVVYGRFQGGGQHQIVVSGTIEGEAAEWPLAITLPDEQADHGVLARVWARQRIEDLMQQAFYADSPAIEEEVTAIALDYGLMSQYTSFVAVDESQAESQGPMAQPPRQMLVPVPLPEGAQWSGFFGGREKAEHEVDFLSLSSTIRPRQEKARLLTAPSRRTVRLSRSRFGRSATSESLRKFRFSDAYAASPRPGADQPASPRGLGQMNLSKLSAGTAIRGNALGGGMGGWGYGGRAMGESRGGAMFGLDMDGAVAEAVVVGAGHADELTKRAQAAAKQYEALKEQDEQMAQAQLVHTVFLAEALKNAMRNDGGIGADALMQLASHRKKMLAQWKQKPLDQRLDLVLRDQTLAEALNTIGNAANVPIEIVPGSLEDVQLLSGLPAHVQYLDLRGVAVVDALEWLLQPLRLTWQPSEKGVTVASQRRLPGLSTWVYDVARIALPSAEELKNLKEGSNTAEFCQAAATRFLDAVNSELKADKDDSIVWFDAGRLLVFGDRERHVAVRLLLDRLNSTELGDQLKGELAELQKLAHQRNLAGKERASQYSAQLRLTRAASAHAEYGWQLLAAAAKGQLEDEAVTRLKIAWKDPATLRLLEKEGRSLAFRSLWSVIEAARMLPDEEELSQLAEQAMERARPFINLTLEAAAEKPMKSADVWGLLYATLALPDGDELRHDCVAAVRSGAKQLEGEPVTLLIAESMLTPKDQPDVSQLLAKLDATAGADTLVLTALACRHAGPQAWYRYRLVSRELLRSPRVSGNVVVLINSLSAERQMVP